MSDKPKRELTAPERLADALVDEILNLSDAEVLSDIRDSGVDPVAHATAMRKLFEDTLVSTNKGRLAAARAGVAATKKSPSASKGLVDISEARARLRAFLDSPSQPPGLTLAARKESEMSDSDIFGMLEDLQELGIALPGVGGEHDD